jgi:hypothetical protein
MDDVEFPVFDEKFVTTDLDGHLILKSNPTS